MTAGLIDCIVTPKQGNRIPDQAMICADNGVYGKGYPGDQQWWAWLRTLPADRVVFAVAPDVVGDAAATLTRSTPWLPRIRSLGMPAALAAQNGLQPTAVPWDELDVLFLGGAVECDDHGPQLDPITVGKGAHQRFYCPACNVRIYEWKLSAAARTLAAEAKRRGKWLHMGRVNGFGRLRYANHIGCDSADGTYLTFGPDTNLPKLFGWLRGVNDQHPLWEAVI